MIEVARLIANGGALPQLLSAPGTQLTTARKRGLKQGGIMTLSSLLLIPLTALFVSLIHANGAIVGVVAVVTFWGGILRMLYAAIFESGVPIADSGSLLPEAIQSYMPGKTSPAEIPTIQQPRAIHQSPQSGWERPEGAAPPSVIDETTKLLDRK
jgi:hypothetical protein